MGIDEPKDRAVQLLKWLLDERDHERFLAALADEVTWTIPGNWPGVSGVKDKAAIVQFVRTITRTFPSGYRSDIHHITGDNSTVIVEFTGRARTAAGRDYENSYCLAVEFRDESVCAIREYMDTLYADTLIFSPRHPS
jgi:ketosteroid isomerase-like protein